MAHAHGNSNTRRVQLALILTAVFTVVELVGGLITGSLALLADAGHMLTDTMALALAAIAFHVSSRPADHKRSYGYQRFQILAAFVNGLCLLVIVGWILYEAATRLLSPREVLAQGMLVVAIAGLIVNIAAFLILHGGDRNNMNMHGAALHVLGDLLGSIAAIVAAVVILATGWTLIDPLLSVLVALLILRSAWLLVLRSSHILLEGAPEWLDVAKMQSAIVSRVPAVGAIHHVHVWGLTQQELMLTMHVVLAPGDTHATESVRQIKEILRSDYDIRHSRSKSRAISARTTREPLHKYHRPELADLIMAGCASNPPLRRCSPCAYRHTRGGLRLASGDLRRNVGDDTCAEAP